LENLFFSIEICSGGRLGWDDIAGLGGINGVLNRGVTDLPAAGRIRAMDVDDARFATLRAADRTIAKRSQSPEVFSPLPPMSTPRSQIKPAYETPKWRPNILMSTYAVNMGWKISCENRRAE
jgi:hypothetical protein